MDEHWWKPESAKDSAKYFKSQKGLKHYTVFPHMPIPSSISSCTLGNLNVLGFGLLLGFWCVFLFWGFLGGFLAHCFRSNSVSFKHCNEGCLA